MKRIARTQLALAPAVTAFPAADNRFEGDAVYFTASIPLWVPK